MQPCTIDAWLGMYEAGNLCRIMGLRVGIFDHLGWAVAVTVSADYDVVDRRKLDLFEPDMPNAPVHHPQPGLSLAEIEAVVARVRASAERATAASFDALPAKIVSVHLRALPTDFPADIATQLRPPYEARADAVMYRQVLTAVAAERGYAVEHYDAKSVEAEAVKILGHRADDVLRAPRKRLGPPWTKDHRTALAAIVVANAS